VSLLDDLRAVAARLDPQYQPTSNEVGPLLGALIAHTEHGDKLTKAAEDDENPNAVNELVAGEGEKKDDSGKKGEKGEKGEK
jgi:hypothetical protein